jgi:hypothetical protein
MVNANFKCDSQPAAYQQSNIANKTISELNGFFISHFLKLMYDTIDSVSSSESPFGNSSSEEIFRDFLINEYGEVMSEKLQLTHNMMGRYVNNRNFMNSTVVCDA